MQIEVFFLSFLAGFFALVMTIIFYFNLLAKMQQNSQPNASALPPQQRSSAHQPNHNVNERAVPTLQTITQTQYVNSRKSKSKPKGLLLTQAAEIRKLNESLSEYRNKYMSLERQRMDRESYENHIKELMDSDSSKKNEIEKLSLTIRSLISSCEAYRKEIGTTNQKIRKAEDLNLELLRKYEAADRDKQLLNKAFEDYKIDKRKQLEATEKELGLNQEYMRSLQKNVEELMKRVNEIPNLQKDLMRTESQNTFWKEETARLNNELAIMDELYIGSEKKNGELEQKCKVAEDKRVQVQKELTATQATVVALKQQVEFLTEQIQTQQVNLNSKNQAFEYTTQEIQGHRNQIAQLESRLSEHQQSLKQKNKLILSLEKQITKLSQEQKGYEQFKKGYQEFKKQHTSEIARISLQKVADLAALNTIIDENKEKESSLKFLLEQRERDTMSQKRKIEQLEAQLIKVSSELHFCEADKQILLKELAKNRERADSNEEALHKLKDQLKAKAVEIKQSSKKNTLMAEELAQEKKKGEELYAKFAKVSSEGLKKDQKILSLSSKITVFEKATANLKSRLAEETSKSTTQDNRLEDLKQQLAQVKEQLNAVSQQNLALRAQRQELSRLLEFKTGEGEQIKRKMIIIENQLLEQFDNNFNESNRVHQESIDKLEKQNEELTRKISMHEVSQRTYEAFVHEDGHVNLRALGTQPQQIFEEDYRERARKIEDKLKEYRQVKKEFEKLKGSLQKTIVQNENLKEELKKEELKLSNHQAKSSSLIEEKQALENERNQIAKMLENKTRECEKLRRKLIQMQDELRAYFEASIQTELHSHRQEIAKIQKEKEDIEEMSKTSLQQAYQALEEETSKTQQLLRSTQEENQTLKKEIAQQGSQCQKAVSKLLEQLERLQAVLTATNERQVEEAAIYESKLTQLEQQLKQAELQREEELKASKLLRQTTASYQSVLTKLQDEFLALQLLVAELKQERNLFMRKNSFMIKGIHTVHEEMGRLDSSAEKIGRLFEPNSSLHEQIGKHNKVIQEAFASLEKFKVVEVSEQIQQEHQQVQSEVPKESDK